MSKTIISVNLIGPQFMDVLFREMAAVATEKSLSPDEAQKAIMAAKDIAEVNNILQEHFGGEIKIRE